MFQWNIRLIPAHLHHSKQRQHGLAFPHPFFVILATYKSAPFILESRRLECQLGPRSILPLSGFAVFVCDAEGSGEDGRESLSLPLPLTSPLLLLSLADEGGWFLFEPRPRPPLGADVIFFGCFFPALNFCARFVTPGPWKTPFRGNAPFGDRLLTLKCFSTTGMPCIWCPTWFWFWCWCTLGWPPLKPLNLLLEGRRHASETEDGVHFRMHRDRLPVTMFLNLGAVVMRPMVIISGRYDLPSFYENRAKFKAHWGLLCRRSAFRKIELRLAHWARDWRLA